MGASFSAPQSLDRDMHPGILQAPGVVTTRKAVSGWTCRDVQAMLQLLDRWPDDGAVVGWAAYFNAMDGIAEARRKRAKYLERAQYHPVCAGFVMDSGNPLADRKVNSTDDDSDDPSESEQQSDDDRFQDDDFAERRIDRADRSDDEQDDEQDEADAKTDAIEDDDQAHYVATGQAITTKGAKRRARRHQGHKPKVPQFGSRRVVEAAATMDTFDPAICNPIFFGYSLLTAEEEAAAHAAELRTGTAEDDQFNVVAHKAEEAKIKTELSAIAKRKAARDRDYQKVADAVQLQRDKRQREKEAAYRVLDEDDRGDFDKEWTATHVRATAEEDAKLEAHRQADKDALADDRMRSWTLSFQLAGLQESFARLRERPRARRMLVNAHNELDRRQAELKKAKQDLDRSRKTLAELEAESAVSDKAAEKNKMLISAARMDVRAAEDAVADCHAMIDKAHKAIKRAETLLESEELVMPLFKALRDPEVDDSNPKHWFIPLMELVVALVILCEDDLDAKLRTCFKLADRSWSQRLGYEQMHRLVVACVRAFEKLGGVPPASRMSPHGCDALVQKLFEAAACAPAPGLPATSMILGAIPALPPVPPFQNALRLQPPAPIDWLHGPMGQQYPLAGVAHDLAVVDRMNLYTFVPLANFLSWATTIIQRSRSLCTLFGTPWRYEYLSDYQRRVTPPMQALRLGMLSLEDAATAIARQRMRHWHHLSTARRATVHRLAQAQGTNDPTKPDYSKFITRKAAVAAKIKPLTHALYANQIIVHQNRQIKAAIAIQRIYRGWAFRESQKLGKLRVAMEEAKRKTILKAERKIKKHFWDLENQTGLKKIKWDTKVRIQQLKLIAEGLKVNRTGTLDFMIKEKMDAFVEKVSSRFDKKLRKKIKRLRTMRLREVRQLVKDEQAEAEDAAGEGKRALVVAPEAQRIVKKAVAREKGQADSDEDEDDDNDDDDDKSGDEADEDADDDELGKLPGDDDDDDSEQRSGRRPIDADSWATPSELATGRRSARTSMHSRKSTGSRLDSARAGRDQDEQPVAEAKTAAGEPAPTAEGTPSAQDAQPPSRRSSGRPVSSHTPKPSGDATDTRRPSGRPASSDKKADPEVDAAGADKQLEDGDAEPQPEPVARVLSPEEEAAAREAAKQERAKKKAEDKERRRRQKLGTLVTLLDEKEEEYDMIDDEFVADDHSIDDDDGKSTESEGSGLLLSRGDLYHTGDTSSEESFYSTDSDELDRELEEEARQAELAAKKLAERMKGVLIAPEPDPTLQFFMAASDDMLLEAGLSGVAAVDGQFWGQPVGSRVPEAVPPLRKTPAQIAREDARRQRKLKKQAQAEEDAGKDPSEVTKTQDAPLSDDEPLSDTDAPPAWDGVGLVIPDPVHAWVVPGSSIHPAEDRFRKRQARADAEEAAIAAAKAAAKAAAANAVSLSILSAVKPGAGAGAKSGPAVTKPGDAGAAEAKYAAPAEEQPDLEIHDEPPPSNGALEMHLRRARGRVVGETMPLATTRQLLVWPQPPVPAWRERLRRACVGLTSAKLDAILCEFPSKRLLMQFVKGFPSYQHLCVYLHMHYDLPVWHVPLFASRLWAMAYTDLETGVMAHQLSVIQWRHEVLLNVMAKSDLATAVMTQIETALNKLRARAAVPDEASGEMKALQLKAAEMKKAEEDQQRHKELVAARKKAQAELDAATNAFHHAREKLIQAEKAIMRVERDVSVFVNAGMHFKSVADGGPSALTSNSKDVEAALLPVCDAFHVVQDPRSHWALTSKLGFGVPHAEHYGIRKEVVGTPMSDSKRSVPTDSAGSAPPTMVEVFDSQFERKAPPAIGPDNGTFAELVFLSHFPSVNPTARSHQLTLSMSGRSLYNAVAGDSGTHPAEEIAPREEEALPLVPRPEATVGIIHRLDWMNRYRAALRLPEASADEEIARCTEIIHVLRDFLQCATERAKVLVEQQSRAPPTERRLTDIAGRTQQVYVQNNIWFKLALDYHGIYNGQDELAAKAAGAAIRNATEYSKCYVQDLNIPLMAVIDHRGFRVLAVANVAIGQSSGGRCGVIKSPVEGPQGPKSAAAGQDVPSASTRLVLGTLDGGVHIANSDPQLSAKVRAAAKTLNLAPHSVKGADDLSSRTLVTPSDLRGYQGLDGQHYLLNFHRVMPAEDPAGTKHLATAERGMSIFWRFLRPEFVRRYPRPLSSDAFSAFADSRSDAWAQSAKVAAATQVLLTATVPNMAKWLSSFRGAPAVRKSVAITATAASASKTATKRRPGRRPVADTWPGFSDLRSRDPHAGLRESVLTRLLRINLTSEMHHRGIPMRHLGLLRSMFWREVGPRAHPITHKSRLEFTDDPTFDIAPGARLRMSESELQVSSDPAAEYNTKAVTLAEPYMEPPARNVTVWTGAVEHAENSPEVRAVLLAELVARTAKNILRHYLREAAARTQVDLHSINEQIYLHVLNCLSGAHAQSELFWNREIVSGIELRFGRRSLSWSERRNLRHAAGPVLPLIVHRISTMMHLTFAGAVIEGPRLMDLILEVAARQDRELAKLSVTALADGPAATEHKLPEANSGPHNVPLMAAEEPLDYMAEPVNNAAHVGTFVRFAQNPDGFLFTVADIANCDLVPRVKHNLVMLTVCEAALLAAHARADKALLYSEMILRDRPIGYWRLNDRKHSTYAKDASPSGSHGRITGTVEFECNTEPVGVTNDDTPRNIRFVRDGKGGISVPYSEQLVPLNPTQGLSVEAWAFVEGGDGMARTILKCGRYGIGVTKGGDWLFSMYCGDYDVEISVVGPSAQVGAWTYVVGTFDGTLMRLYINGALEATAELYREANYKAMEDIDETQDAEAELNRREAQKVVDVTAETKKRAQAYFTSLEGSTVIHRRAKKIVDNEEIKAKLSAAQKVAHAVGIKTVGMEQATAMVQEEEYQRMLAEALARVKEEFVLRREQAKKEREFQAQGGAETARLALRIGTGPITKRHKDGSHPWQGRVRCMRAWRTSRHVGLAQLAHVAVYLVPLSRDQIMTHFRRGSRASLPQTQRLYRMAVDRFKAALYQAPDNQVILTKYAATLCNSMRDQDLLNDHMHPETIQFHALIREAILLLVKRRNVAGLASILLALPSELAVADLACDVYEAMLAVEPVLGQVVPFGYDGTGRVLGGEIVTDGGSVEHEQLLKAGLQDRQAAQSAEPDMDAAPGAAAGMRDGVLAGFRTDKDIMTMLKLVPARFKWNTAVHDPRQLAHAARVYRAVLSRNSRAYRDVPLEWVSKMQAPGAVTVLVRRVDEELDEYSLDLRNATDMTDTEISQVMSYNRQLRLLDILRLARCKLLTDTVLVALAPALNRIQELDLSGCPRISDPGVIMISEKCDLLARIILDNCQLITDAAIVSLAKNCPDLTHVRLDWCVAVSDAALIALSRSRCALKLEHVDVAHCRRVSDAGLLALTKAAVNIQIMNISACRSITNRGLQSISNRLWHMQQLWMCDLPLVSADGFVFDTDIDGRPNAHKFYLRELQELYMTDCPLIEDHAVDLIMVVARSLQVVQLSTCGTISDRTLLVLGGVEPDDIATGDAETVMAATEAPLPVEYEPLVALGSVVEDIAAAEAARTRARVAMLNPRLMRAVDEASSLQLRAVLSVPRDTSDLPDVEPDDEDKPLVLADTVRLRLAETVAPPVVVSALLDPSKTYEAVLTGLRYLDLTFCPDVTDVGLKYLLPRAPALETLAISGCIHVTEASLLVGVNSCPRLQTLRIAHIRSVSDALLVRISEVLWLEHLDISHCAAVTDAGLMAVADKCVGLLSVKAEWCRRITAASVCAILKNCKTIQNVDVQNCDLVDMENVNPYYRIRQLCTVRDSTNTWPGLIKQQQEEAAKQQVARPKSRK